ncbi:MAG: PhoU domain-containing protein [Bilophila wadsworthia]
MCLHGLLVIHLLDSVQEVFFNDKKDLIPKIEETEAKIDQLHKAVKAYAEDIMQAGISDDAARVLTLYVASSGNIERIGDYGKKLLEYYAYRQNRPKDFSQQAMTELSGMYAEAHHAIVTALDGFINDDPDKAREVAPIAGKLRGLEVELRNRHIQRLDKQECDSETGLVYVDILGIIEHIGYHSNNVAKATISPARRSTRRGRNRYRERGFFQKAPPRKNCDREAARQEFRRKKALHEHTCGAFFHNIL